jgi:hypothetical protein
MMKWFDVGKFIIKDVKMFFKVLLSELFFAIDLMLNLLPTIVEEFHFGSRGGEGRNG